MPTRASLDPSRLEELGRQVRGFVEDGPLPAAQVAVARDGRVVCDLTFGAAGDARFHAFSLTKLVVAGVVGRLVDAGVVDLGLRVADVIEGFGDHGKEQVRLHHLLLHTAGLALAPMRPLEGADRQARLARFASWEQRTPPGQRSAYHATSAHWVLAEVLERLTGLPLPELTAREVLRPLELHDTSLGVPLGGDPEGRVRPPVPVGVPTPAATVAALAAQGFDLDAAVGEATTDAAVAFADPAVRAAGVPGAGLVTTARDLVRYLQALLHDPSGLWSADTRAELTTAVRNDLPDTVLGVPSGRSYGAIVAGDDGHAAVRGFGGAVGPRTFGHGGVGGQLAWADPDSGLSVCLLTDGIDRDPLAANLRAFQVSSVAAAMG